jgi:hypothetical protein
MFCKNNKQLLFYFILFYFIFKKTRTVYGFYFLEKKKETRLELV